MKSKTHIMVFPMPIQGHINPMLQFSKQLASKGLNVTLVTTTSCFSKSSGGIKAGPVNVETISDASEDVISADNGPAGYMDRFNIVVSRNLSKLVREKRDSNIPPKVLVYDSAVPWALDVAREHGLLAATFFTQPCSVCSIIYHLHKGNLKIPEEGNIVVSLPGLPLLKPNDFPLFFYNGDKSHNFMKFMVHQFSNISEVDWVFFNTFDMLEEEVVNWMKSQFPLRTIGPTVPALDLHKDLEDEKGYGFSLFKQSTESYMKWLATKAEASVIYISFGSLANLGEEQMLELAHGLKNSGHYFLWVVRTSEECKLPTLFKEETSEKGLIVSWCSQIEVLSNKAIGCFMTHCGWNSTMEGLAFGVPMVAMPQWSDQPTNAKCVTDMWNVGIRLKVNEKGIIPREEIELCIKDVMEGDQGIRLRNNAIKWKMLATEALGKGGSTDNNINEFVSEVGRL